MRRSEATLIATGAVLVAALAGARYRPTPDQPRNAIWYASLRKPSFRFRGPLIGVMYTAVDVLSAYAGSRLIAAPPSPARTVAVAGWGVAVAGLFAYPWAMFERHRLDGGWAVAGSMIAGAAAAVGAGVGVDRRAAGALVPVLAWLGFSGVLQEETWRRNP